MRKSWRVRVLAFLVLVPISTAGPAAALAHAEAHHHALEQHDGAAIGQFATISDAHHETGNHDHPRLSAIAPVRAGVSSPAFVALPAHLPLLVPLADCSSAPRIDVFQPSHANPNTGPPPRLRAPPLI